MKSLFTASAALLNFKTIVNFFSIHNLFDYKNCIRKFIIYGIAFVFLSTAYVFGCIAFYCFLLPYWGETLSAFSLFLLSLIISVCLIIGGRFLKSKKKQPSPPITSFFEQGLDLMTKSQDLTKLLEKASPKVLVTVLGVVALTAYIMCSKKKEKQ